ncbi:MCA1 [Symbiodinium sp. CCMP2592]|nr:MCA1 [Symbiodinium sp. CCMP2592]
MVSMRVSERCATQSAADATESSKLKEELEVQLQDRLGQTRSDLAECAQLTQVVSERLEAVEAQLRAELAKLMVLGQQTAVRMEEVCTAVQEATAGSGALSGSDSTKVHLEEMINTALERTEHLEQSFIAASSGPAAGLAEQVSKCRQDLQAQIEDLRNRSTSCETRLLQELERVSEVMRLAPGRDEAELKPLEPSKVRSVPAALRGMVLSCLPLPAHAGRRKALVIGCSYFESNTPLKGAINDAWNVLSLLRHTLQISESQVRFIVDGTRSCPMPPQRRPTAATIAEGLQWLAADTLPGDEVFLYFAGYGALLPHGVGSFEACLVPIDYAALKSGGGDSTGGYRLVPLTEVSQALSKLPAGCKATVVLDCCHSSLPGVGSKPQPAMFQWAQMQPAAFAGMDEMADARARRLVLPSIPLRAPQAIEVPAIECSLTCYSACHQAQWCGELPIEGVVQGAFTWAWVKAMVAGNCEGSVSQVKASLQASIGDLQRRCRWLDQTPLVQMSKAMEQQAGRLCSFDHHGTQCGARWTKAWMGRSLLSAMGWEDWQDNKGKENDDWYKWQGGSKWWQKESNDWHGKKRVKSEWDGWDETSNSKQARWEDKPEYSSWNTKKQWQERDWAKDVKGNVSVPNADLIPRTPPEPKQIPRTPAAAFSQQVPPTPAGAFGARAAPLTPNPLAPATPTVPGATPGMHGMWHPPTPPAQQAGNPFTPTTGMPNPLTPTTGMPNPLTPTTGMPNPLTPTTGMPPTPGMPATPAMPQTPANPGTPAFPPATPAQRILFGSRAGHSGLSTPGGPQAFQQAMQSQSARPSYNMPRAPAFTGNVSGDLRHAPRRRNGKLAPAPSIKAKVRQRDTPSAGSAAKKALQDPIPDFKTWRKDKKPIEFKDVQPPVKSETPVPLQPGSTTPGLPTGALTPGDVVGMTPGFAGGDVTPMLEQPGVAPGMYGSLYGQDGGVTPPQITGMTPGFAMQGHRASVVLHVKGRNAGEGKRRGQARWGHGSNADVAGAPSTAGSACSGCSICGGSAHKHLADCLHDNDSAGLEVEPTGLPAVVSGWREVPLRDGDAEEAPAVGLPPLRVCAVVCGDDGDGMCKGSADRLDLELRVVADPLALAQRARFAIYPPWRLGPHLRFSWRLEKRSREEVLSPSGTGMERTHGRDPGRRPRALTGIGGVSGGFGGGTSSSFDVDVYTELAHEKTQANASSRAFQLLSNTMDAEAEVELLLPLRGHQLRSLAWMQACEAENREPLLLGVSREFFPTLHPPHAAQQLLCEALGCRAVARVQRAFHLRGGLLADQVGSGKTAVTLGLVASDGSQPEASRCRRTLVLVPGRLLQQWQQEVRKFLPANAVELYLGVCDIPERGAVPQLLLSPVEILATAGKRPRMEASAASADMDLAEMAHKLRAICLSGVDRIVVDEFHEILDSASGGRLLALQELWADCGEGTALWGLTGTPPLSDFASVARIAEAFKIDLQAFRRQLDAREIAQRMLDYAARANGSSALSGLDVHEELVSLYHTPAERAIYVQGVADAKRKHKQQKQMGQVDQPVCSDLLQLCSHFRLEEADVEADAERESASLLRTRADAVETARQWLLVSARRMEAEILSARRRGNGLPTLVAEQYAQLLAEVGGEPLSRSTEAVASQIAGASAARQSAGQGRRHERDADDLILRAITEVRDSGLASAASGAEVVSEGAPQNPGDSLELLVELLEEGQPMNR